MSGSTSTAMVATAPAVVVRLAARSVAQHRPQGLLVIFTSLVGTAIACACLSIGDSLEAAIRDLARTQYGPIDEILSTSDVTALPKLETAVQDIAGSDGTLAMVSTMATAAGVGDSPRAEPYAAVHEVDFGAARAFGLDIESTGFADAGNTPGPGEAALGIDLADDLGLGVGDTVEVISSNRVLRLRVSNVLPRLGVAGFHPAVGSSSPVLFVALGTVAQLTEGGGAFTAPVGRILVSNDGGVFGGAKGSRAMADRLRDRLGAFSDVDINLSKQDVLQTASAQGATFRFLFGGVAGFTMLGGMSLLVSAYVGTAEARRAEVGVLRAVGLKRSHLVSSFGLEGMGYALVAGVVGALAGVALGRGVVLLSGWSLGTSSGDLSLPFSVTSHSILLATLIGFAISLLSLLAAGVRLGCTDVVTQAAVTARTAFLPVRFPRYLLLVGGVAAFWLGASRHLQPLVLAGPIIALFAAVPLVLRRPARASPTAVSTLALAWAVLSPRLIPSVFTHAGPSTSVLRGVVIVAAAVTLTTSNIHLLGRLAGRADGARLALASSPGRRSFPILLMATCSFSVLSLSFLSTLSYSISEQTPRLIRESSAGYDLLVDSSPVNPVIAEQLEAASGVDVATSLLRSVASFAPSSGASTSVEPLTGFDERWLQDHPVGRLRDRAESLETDEAVWRMVLEDPRRAIVPIAFLADDGLGRRGLEPGELFTLRTQETGEETTLEVAGVIASDVAGNGVLVSASLLREELGGAIAVANRHYVTVHEGVPPAEVADRLTSGLVANGVDARTFSTVVGEALTQQKRFLRLTGGLIGVGVLVALAGLCTTVASTLQERRRQISTLRAIGCPARTLSRALITEVSLLAGGGAVLGTVVGSASAHEVLTSGLALGSVQLGFALPWVPLLALLLAVLTASVLAAAVLATRAVASSPTASISFVD